MPKLKLSDGTEFDGIAAVTGYNMQLKTSLQSAQEHLLDFGDRKKMKTVEFNYGLYKNIYHGYDRFGSLELDSSNNIARIWMHGDENSYVEKDIPAVPEEYLPKEQ